MRIAILVKEFPPDVIGGTETQTYRMATELQARGHEVTIYTKAYNGDETLNTDFELVRVPNVRFSAFLSTLTFVVIALYFLIRNRDRHDVLQCMMIYPNGFIGYLVGHITGLPYFSWIRGGDYYFMRDNPVKRHLISRVLSDTLVLVQTEQILRDVRADFPDANLEILGNGVSIPDQIATGNKIVYVGRLENQKGVHLLLRAIAGFDEPVLVVGDGSERKRLEDMADSLELEATFTGEVPPHNVSRYLLKGKLFVLPSVRGEGLPNAILEAMAVGLPVVATDTGGVVDIISENDTGFVVDSGDEMALREQIRRLCRNEILRSRMGKTAREYVRRNHSWDSVLSELEIVYQTVTAKSQE